MMRVFVFAVLLALTFGPFAAQAQIPSPITVTVQAGIDGIGTYRPNHWFPVTVTLANDGADRQITLEWRDVASNELVQRRRLSLPGGARKQVIVPAVHRASRFGTLTVLADGVEIQRERIALNPLNDDQLAIGLLSSDPTVLSSLAVASFPNNQRAVLVSIRPEQLPTDPLFLSMLDIVIIHELTAELQPEQRDALLTWVQGGGVLLVGGGPRSDAAVRAFDSVLPVTVGPLRRDVPVTALERLANLSGLANFVPSLTANTVTLRPNAQSLTDDNLISQNAIGAGQIVFAAFDLAALRAWPGEANLWSALLAPQGRIDPGASFRFGFNNLLQGSLRQSLFSIPSPLILLTLISAYIVVIGPLNFFLLRRLRRLEWGWVTTPLLIAVFLAGAYGMGYALRGRQAQIINLTVMQSAAGGGPAITTHFTGIFAPQRQQYRLEFAPDTLISPLITGSGPMVIERADSGGPVAEVQFDAAATRALIIEQITISPITINHQLTNRDGNWQGAISNTGASALTDVIVVAGNTMQWIGDLPPGKQVTINLPSNNDTFLRDFMPASETSLFYHTGVLENLFWYGANNNRFLPFVNSPVLPGNLVYLIGWTPEAAPAVQIDGAAPVRGETLHIIALR